MRPTKVTKRAIFLAIREKKTKRQLAEELGVKIDTINSALSRYGIRWESSGVLRKTHEEIEAERVIEEAVARENLLPWERHPQDVRQ